METARVSAAACAIAVALYLSISSLAPSPENPEKTSDVSELSLPSPRRRLRAFLPELLAPQTVRIKTETEMEQIFNGPNVAPPPPPPIASTSLNYATEENSSEQLPVTWSAPPKITENIECGRSLSKVPLYVIDDLCSLGHMQMSFVHLFHWLLTISSSGRIGYTLYKIPCKELQPISETCIMIPCCAISQ